jgi:UDP-3-O-[3-hydroxymyristoyl] glucosamine N-acyltransferase
MPARVETLEISAAALLDHAGTRGLAPFGPENGPFTWVEPLDQAGPADIAFCRFEGEAGLQAILASRAGALFVPLSLLSELPQDRALYLPCAHPRLELLHLLRRFWREAEWTFDPAANPSIHPSARIAEGVRVGPFTVIGPGVSIGAGTRIGSNCHIERVDIGRDCIVANCVTIGRYGFGYEDDPDTGEVLQFPHIGGVVIGDRVEIGSSTCVDRGSIGHTVIGDDCKIDNLIHVAHNVRMGRRCKVIALAIIGGSVVLGDDAWIAPAAAIRDWRKVGAKAVVGIGAVVTKDVPDGETVVGNPARPMSRTRHRYK